MSLLTLVITLIVVGILLWLVNKYVPMDAKIKNIINIVVLVVVVIWILKAFGLFDQASNIKVPKIQ